MSKTLRIDSIYSVWVPIHTVQCSLYGAVNSYAFYIDISITNVSVLPVIIDLSWIIMNVTFAYKQLYL